ncbi:hypothetical protein PQR46_32200 [Paraburkholderia sediminicola]|uniref:hypothetical protein n=1 Tax=Paraburkholderia sediminicola TaxID=458836 RepID=UPI0038B9B7A0
MNKQFSRLVVLTSCAALLHGCGATAQTAKTGGDSTKDKSSADKPASSPDTGRTIPKAKTPSLIILSDTCPVTNIGPQYEFAFLVPILLAAGSALVNAILPKLINSAVGAGADYLQKRADSLNASSTAFTNGSIFKRTTDDKGNLSPFQDRNGCLVFIRGGLTSTADSKTTSGDWNVATMNRVNDSLSKANIKSLFLTSRPEVYAEFNIHYRRSVVRSTPQKQPNSGNPKFIYQAIGFAPAYIDFSKTGAVRRTSDSKQLIFQIVLSASPIQSGQASGSTILDQTIDLGEMKIDSSKQTSDLAYKSPQFAKIPQPSVIPLTNNGDKKVSGYVDDEVAIGVQVTLTETEDGGDVERSVAAGLRENESKISDAVTQAVVGLIPKAKKD